MKYQSELIKEMVDSRGHEKSSHHYQSECIETWIEEAKGAYPKLCDYESEWLNYITQNPIGEFPYETVSTNTTATVNHVVPYAYKSAILKGDTLVNLVSSCDFGGNDRLYEYRFFDQPAKSGETITVFVVNPNISTIRVGLFNPATDVWKKNETFDVTISKKVVYTIPSDFVGKYVGVVVNNSNDSTGFENGLVIVRGDQTQLEVNTYFEGMQSVKMPVLTTVGKNLFNGILLEQWSSISGEISNNSKTRIIKMKVKPNTTYVVARTESGNRLDILMFASEPMLGVNTVVGTSLNSGGNATVTSFTTTKDTSWIIIRAIDNIDNYTSSVDFQVEEGTTATPYEPYKTNILTVNEDVTLRSNGDVYDELNLLTGRLTQRIDENNEVLAQAVVKTVDLSVTDQDGNTLNKIKPIEGTMNITVSGEPVAPTAVLEVPVEAVTQNLNSFIEEE